MKKFYMVVTLIIVISACSCSSDQKLFSGTATANPTLTFTKVPTATETQTVEPTKTRMFTQTPTPFQNLYWMAGATDAQSKVMDKAILDFVNAVKKDDKEFVAGMMVYPTWLTIDDEPTKVTNKNEFMKYYDSVFTENLKNSLSQLKLNNDYIFATYRGICLMHDDEKGLFQIWFSSEYDGKITWITYGDYTKKNPVTAIPTYTLVPTKTPQPPGVLIVQSSPTPTITPYWFTLSDKNEKSYSTYYGIWIITRYEYRGSSAFGTNEFADSQIGKKIELLANEITVDKDFLWFSKTSYKNASYGWADENDFINGGWQVLLPDENPDKHQGLLFLDFYYNNGYALTGMEVSKTGRLVIFDDGYWFFLDKVMEP
ncbi:MAG: hypothetical protein C0410_02810 [Anaerolinea sp.]|nr:hypothetical protein [Anaerolinea sp.]